MAIDILGPLLETDNKNILRLVIMDYFIKSVEAYSIQNKETSSIL